jgi:hypothetical protein
MPGFMLNTERLLASELWALADGTTFKAAMALWCRAWQQVPAASLPDDDIILRSYAGVSASIWKKIRELALRGFVRCHDGRLYHWVLAEDAVRAWEKRKNFNERATRAAQARWDKGKIDPSSMREASRMHAGSDARVMLGDAQGQGQGQGTHISTPPPTPGEPPRAASAKDFLDGGETVTITTVRARSFADFQAMHPRILVARDERTTWEALLTRYGWDPMSEGVQALTTRLEPSKRVLLSMLTGWLDANFMVDV